MHNHLSVIVMKCPDCGIQFSSNEAFQLHILEQHKRFKEEPDSYTNTSSGKSDSKKRTRRTSKIDVCTSLAKSFHCQSCSFATKTEHLLQKHVETLHNPQRKIYSCHLCSYTCSQERTFRLHQLKHADLEAKFACDQCGKLFLSMGIMKRHSLTHSKSKPFVCVMKGCNKSFNIKSRLTDHMRSVHKSNIVVPDSGFRNREFSCSGKKSVDKVSELTYESCDTLCTRRNTLPVSSGPFDDGSGGKVTEEEKTVANNTISKNNDSFLGENTEYLLRPQTCNSTERRETKNQPDPNVITVYDVILFDNLHSTDSDRNYSGQSRSKSESFSITQSVISKKKSFNGVKVKQNVLKFSCSWAGCGKRFRDGYNLRMHTCTHTGEMQRACKICGYTCVQKSALDRHMIVHQRLKL